MARGITQTKDFAGSSATVGSLPSKKLSVATVTTYAPSALDATGFHAEASVAIFTALAAAMAPEEPSPTP